MRSSRRNNPPEGPAGVLFELIHNRFPRGGGYWLTAFLFGAIFPTLVALLIVLPLKGRPIGGGWQPALLITAFLINGVWGVGTAWFLKVLSGVRTTAREATA
jgi:hypothetical protein